MDAVPSALGVSMPELPIAEPTGEPAPTEARCPEGTEGQCLACRECGHPDVDHPEAFEGDPEHCDICVDQGEIEAAYHLYAKCGLPEADFAHSQLRERGHTFSGVPAEGTPDSDVRRWGIETALTDAGVLVHEALRPEAFRNAVDAIEALVQRERKAAVKAERARVARELVTQ